jgi:hypothetical protein
MADMAARGHGNDGLTSLDLECVQFASQASDGVVAVRQDQLPVDGQPLSCNRHSHIREF